MTDKSYLRASRLAQVSFCGTMSAMTSAGGPTPAPHAPERRGRPRRIVVRLAAGTLVGLLLVELMTRIATHSLFLWGSDDMRGKYGMMDPVVGRIPRPGVSVRLSGGADITIGDHSTRNNGQPKPARERPVTLVVGDSFAFGDGVSDDASWPAILERLSGERVINGAVPGFGLDQAVLRASELADVYAPETILVGFIPHDIRRCEMSFWSGNAKPYFDIDQTGNLRLEPAPPLPEVSGATLRKVLSYSVAMDRLFTKFLHWEAPNTVVHHQGREVACLLMDRLAALGRDRSARVVVMAQPQEPTTRPEDRELTEPILDCARESGLRVLDLLDAIAQLAPEQRSKLFLRHMTVEGNTLVATQMLAFLAQSAPSP